MANLWNCLISPGLAIHRPGYWSPVQSQRRSRALRHIAHSFVLAISQSGGLSRNRTVCRSLSHTHTLRKTAQLRPWKSRRLQKITAKQQCLAGVRLLRLVLTGTVRCWSCSHTGPGLSTCRGNPRECRFFPLYGVSDPECR